MLLPVIVLVYYLYLCLPVSHTHLLWTLCTCCIVSFSQFLTRTLPSARGIDSNERFRLPRWNLCLCEAEIFITANLCTRLTQSFANSGLTLSSDGVCGFHISETTWLMLSYNGVLPSLMGSAVLVSKCPRADVGYSGPAHFCAWAHCSRCRPDSLLHVGLSEIFHWTVLYHILASTSRAWVSLFVFWCWLCISFVVNPLHFMVKRADLYACDYVHG